MKEFPEKLHIPTVEEIFKIYETSINGLSEKEVERRRAIYGKNVLSEKEENKWKIFFRQFNNILIYVLIAASIISLILHKHADFGIIMGIIVINSIIGFIQEIKAITSIKVLKKLTESRVEVIRDKRALFLASAELVPGDIVIVNEGSIITSDMRLIESSSLMADEASITGESMPVIKDYSAKVEDDALPYELKNMLLEGTSIVRGYAKGIVLKTGNNTYLATIAKEAQAPQQKSPLTKAIDFFSKRYMFYLIALFLAIGIAGYIMGRSWLDLAYILIAELVSVLPEGLPIVVTIVMVIGAIALSKKKTLIRTLPSVETLGSATVIASDKTGTITEGILKVKESYILDDKKLRLIAALCNDTKEKKGDPIDIALSEWIDDFEELNKKYPRLESFPFDVQKRSMATVNEIDGQKMFLIKGAYESLKELAANVKDFEKIEKELHKFSENGLRTLAFGMGEYQKEDSSRIEIVGIIGFLDPPKKGVKEAVMHAKAAGMKVIMITGDHPITAKAVAKEVGIYNEGDFIITGKDIDNMNDEELFISLKKTTVLARILPEHKTRIVDVLQKNKEIVAVSGDGVNDVPALKKADLGIAMGSGTEAAKNVANMIITDSNLNIIVEAIRNGRVITDNIRKVIYYLVSSGLQEVALISFAIFSNLPLPLTPIQILWINLVGDGVQDKTFPFAKEEGDVMKRSPIKPNKKFFDARQIFNIVSFGLFNGFTSFFLFRYLLKNDSYEIALTLTFTTVVLTQWFNGVQAQKDSEPFFKNVKRSFTINPYIYLGVGIGIVLQIFAVYFEKGWFSTVSVPLHMWKYPIIISFFGFLFVEIRKWIWLLIKRNKT